MDKVWNKVRENAHGYLEKNDDRVHIVIDELGEGLQYELSSDIKHVMFKLSRYKFASKMIRFKKQIDILELGCGEAIGSMMLLQNNDVSSYVGIDFDESSIQWNAANLKDHRAVFITGDFNNCKIIDGKKFDVVISLDVIEHIEHDNEDVFLQTITGHLKEGGVAIIGTPHINMDPYASAGSKIGHVNLFDQKRLYNLTNQYFNNVFIFNMNDECVNMSFDNMSCYIFAVCCNG